MKPEIAHEETMWGASFRAPAPPGYSDLPRRHMRQTQPPVEDSVHKVIVGQGGEWWGWGGGDLAG